MLVCKVSATFELDGQPVYLHPGALVRRGHPILTDHGDLFEPLILQLDYEPDLAPSKATVVVVGGNGDAHGLEYGRDAIRAVTWRTKPAVLW